MRVAVLSDIHGFSLALETVLDDLDRTGPYDEIVVAGDLCEVGPAPAEVLDLLQERDLVVLTGNTDADLVEAARLGGARGSHRYAIAQIGEPGLAYLADLPFSHRLTPPGALGPEHDLLVVHANPRNLLDRIMPGASDHELREVIGGEEAGAIAFGHYHVCFTRTIDETLLVDVSAVGNPKDGDLRCKYGVLTWNEAGRVWTAEIRKLPYPLDATEAQIMESPIPNPRKVFEKLQRASYAF